MPEQRKSCSCGQPAYWVTRVNGEDVFVCNDHMGPGFSLQMPKQLFAELMARQDAEDRIIYPALFKALSFEFDRKLLMGEEPDAR